MRRLTRLREELRQRRHHRAFRIPPPLWTQEQCARLEPLLALVRQAAPAPPPADQSAPETDEAALKAAATNLWHAQRKVAQAGERPSARDRQAARYLRRCADALAGAGLVIQDHDGEPFHPGLALEVLAYEKDPTLTAETIIQTVRPSVYLHGRLVQMAQVIVGIPCQPPDARSDHA